MINPKYMYGSTDVLGKALNASFLRNEVINNNIANVDTPNYKRKDVAFETLFQRALQRNDKEKLERDLQNTEARVYTDHGNYNYRIDGNNVDVDTEMSYLAMNQLKYNALTSQVSYNFTRLKAVLK